MYTRNYCVNCGRLRVEIIDDRKICEKCNFNQDTKRFDDYKREQIEKTLGLRSDEKRVIVTDSEGNTYHKDWKKTAKDGQAVIWTIEEQEIDYYIDDIVKIEVIKGVEE